MNFRRKKIIAGVGFAFIAILVAGAVYSPYTTGDPVSNDRASSVVSADSALDVTVPSYYDTIIGCTSERPSYASIEQLADTSDVILRGKVTDVVQREIDIAYDPDHEFYLPYNVYSISIEDTYKADFEENTIEVKVSAGSSPYFKIGDEGLFFLATYEDSIKSTPAELLNSYQAYIGIDWEKENVVFSPYDVTFDEIKALIEAF